MVKIYLTAAFCCRNFNQRIKFFYFSFINLLNPNQMKTFFSTSFVNGKPLSTGGGPTFLSTFRNEIIPFIDKQYLTTYDRGIFGHSGGGLFAAYCLLTASDLFQRFGIFSPSFWVKNGEMFTLEKSFSNHNNTLNAKVFITVGSLEGDMVTLMTSFADSLKRHN
jgi:predicted alpha/beta superfamily hydrolase